MEGRATDCFHDRKIVCDNRNKPSYHIYIQPFCFKPSTLTHNSKMKKAPPLRGHGVAREPEASARRHPPSIAPLGRRKCGRWIERPGDLSSGPSRGIRKAGSTRELIELDELEPAPQVCLRRQRGSEGKHAGKASFRSTLRVSSPNTLSLKVSRQQNPPRE